MSRMRQIPAMDVSQREKMLEHNPSSYVKNTRGTVPMCSNPRSMPCTCRPRVKRQPVAKFRLSDAPALISTGCSSVRQLCSNVQNITMDLNNLMGSVESMVPLLNTYLTAMQNRSAAVTEPEEPIEVIASQPNDTVSTPMPRPEDMKALLENPLVHNLLTNFMQNGAFPNISAMKENTPHQS